MIDFCIKNKVISGLSIILVFILGFFFLKSINLEVFPNIQKKTIYITTVFQGTTPEEIQENITTPIENKIYNISGIKKMTSTSSFNSSKIKIEALQGYDLKILKEDLEEQINSITNLPSESEDSKVNIAKRSRQIIYLTVFGVTEQKMLEQAAQNVESELSALIPSAIVEIYNKKNPQINVIIDKKSLLKYNLTFAEMVNVIKRSSVDSTIGQIKSSSNNISIKANAKIKAKESIENTILKSNFQGSNILVSDVAQVIDTYDDNDDSRSYYDQLPGVLIKVNAEGNFNAITIADQIKEYVKEKKLPSNINIEYWGDSSKTIENRIETMFNSAIQGSILIIIILTLFLKVSLALMVAFSILFGTAATFIFMYFTGITINLLSVFGFILVLGIVVDDGIITAESIYRTANEKKIPPQKAASLGTHLISTPVTFGCLTTVAAFAPFFFIDHPMGNAVSNIGATVIGMLLSVLIYTKLIMPHFCAKIDYFEKKETFASKYNLIKYGQIFFNKSLIFTRDRLYFPLFKLCLNYKLATFSILAVICVYLFSLLAGGKIKFTFFPDIEQEVINIDLSMPDGSSVQVTQTYIDKIRHAVDTVAQKHIDPQVGSSVITNTMYYINASSGSAYIETLPFEERELDITTKEIVDEIREELGTLVGIKNISFNSSIRFGAASPIDIRILGYDNKKIEQAVPIIKKQLLKYEGVFGIKDTLNNDSQEIKITLKPKAKSLGLDFNDIVSQLRSGFFGSTALNFQRNSDDVDVVIKLPASQRDSITDLNEFEIRVNNSQENYTIPVKEIANLSYEYISSSISHNERKRNVNVKADINKETANIDLIQDELSKFIEQNLSKQFPELKFELSGDAEEQNELSSTIRLSFIISLFVIYILLAIPLNSFFQPFIIMSVIPIGFLNALLGHYIMGMNFSFMSIMGIMALSGVVINDALVLMDLINTKIKQIKEEESIIELIQQAALTRFKAVILTSITTAAGLFPLVFFEQSLQAQFLKPMAVSLGFGVLFSTVVTLIVIPIFGLISFNISVFFNRLKVRIFNSQSNNESF